MSNPLERIGVIGDIHAEDGRLAAAIAFLEARAVERILATGDIADGTGSVDACCDLLESHGVVTVSGNHERWLLSGGPRNFPGATALESISPRSHGFLARLPRMVELGTSRGLALLCHGIGPNDMAKVTPDDFGYAIATNDDLQNLLRDRTYRWVINGHSHRRMVRAFPGVTIINAGTLRSDHEPGFLEIDFAEEAVFMFEFAGDGGVAPVPIRVPLV